MLLLLLYLIGCISKQKNIVQNHQTYTFLLPCCITIPPPKPATVSRCVCISYSCYNYVIRLCLCCVTGADVLPAGKNKQINKLNGQD